MIELSSQLQGLFARVGSGDPVRVLRLFHNNYTGYCCIHLLCIATYNLSLPRLSANYYGLPMTVQLRAAHESRCSLVGVSRSTALQVLYCTCLERYNYGTVHSIRNVNSSYRGKIKHSNILNIFKTFSNLILVMANRYID